MNELEKLIADSIAARSARIEKAAAARLAEEARYAALHQKIVKQTIERASEAIPAPLREHVNYYGGQPSKQMLDARTWRPSEIRIDAPGLNPIRVTIADTRTGEIYICSLRVDGDNNTYGVDDWADVIAVAAEKWREMDAEF